MTDWQQKYDEMVEKAARAICVDRGYNPDAPWRDYGAPSPAKPIWHQFRADAQAALAANEITPDRPVWIAPGWQAMETAPKTGVDVLLFYGIMEQTHQAQSES